MIVRNTERESILGEAIEVAETAAQRVKGLLGRDALADGQGLLFKHCSSMHTFFMHFPIDIIYTDKKGKVLKLAPGVRPFKLVAGAVSLLLRGGASRRRNSPIKKQGRRPPRVR